MEVHDNDLSDVDRFIELTKDVKLEDVRDEFDSIVARIRKYRDINEGTRFLEIGIGTGNFPLQCELEGISCKGLEISSQLVEYVKNRGDEYGIDLDIELGNIETADIGVSKYDVIIATTVFEHVEFWQEGIIKIYNALKPGGLLYFCSTNKFSIIQTEYHFPLYGWLPDGLRYRLRRYKQGDDIMKLGIDFHQFTHFGLRRFFEETGFSKVMDWVEFVDPEVLANPSSHKRFIIMIIKKIKLLKYIALMFSRVTSFICVK